MSPHSDSIMLMASVNGSTLSRLGPLGRHHRQGMEMVEKNERTNLVAGVMVMMTGVLLSIILAWTVSSWVNLATIEEPLPHIPPAKNLRLFELAYGAPGVIWYSPADLGIATERFSKRYSAENISMQLAQVEFD